MEKKQKIGLRARDFVFRVTGSTPELTQGNRKSQFHEFAGELTSKVNPTTSHVVNGSNCQTQLLLEESRVVGTYFA